MIKRNPNMSFSELYVAKRLRKNSFLYQINLVIDWKPIEKELNNIYKKGVSVDGRPSYSGLLLFKMLLLETWYGLSDVKVEEMVSENLSAMNFCGLQLEDNVPDHSTLSRFRTDLTYKKAFERILQKINKQLEDKGIKVKSGAAMVDASITDTPLKPHGKTEYEIAEDRKEDERSEQEKEKEESSMKLIKKQQPGVDTEARWVKKGGKLRYGYKKHISVDEDGLVSAVHTTTANEHDSKGLEELINKTPLAQMSSGVFADKGYKTSNNDKVLKNKKIKNRIQHKAYRNKPLTQIEKLFNRLIGKQRYKVERTFGGIVRWFGKTQARYRGMQKTHTQHILQAIAYNLYRTPGLIVSKCVQ